MAFRTPSEAAHFFTRVLTHPAEVVPPAALCAAGRMAPSPVVEYYWPPTLEDCIAHHEQDLRADASQKLTIDRVFVLGAGFSAAFGFTTAKDIVSGTLKWAEHYQRSDWIARSYHQVVTYLERHFRYWRAQPPSLYDFIDSFFSAGNRVHTSHLAHSNDPFGLAEQGVSWENGNYEDWFEKIHAFPTDDAGVLPAFEGLMAIYLIAGLIEGDLLQQGWASAFVRSLRPSDVILTFNWDVLPEAIMVREEIPFCRYDWTSSRVKLVKLHGSVDLLGVPNPLMRTDMERNPERFECVTKYLWRARTSAQALVHTKPFPFGRALWPQERYNKGAVLIMPPRYPLGYGFHLTQFNWRKARTALNRARQIYIIGYSLPAADLAFRELVRKVSGTWSESVTVDVWNPDPEVGTRAQALFGDRVIFHQAEALTFRARSTVTD